MVLESNFSMEYKKIKINKNKNWWSIRNNHIIKIVSFIINLNFIYMYPIPIY